MQIPLPTDSFVYTNELCAPLAFQVNLDSPLSYDHDLVSIIVQTDDLVYADTEYAVQMTAYLLIYPQVQSAESVEIVVRFT